GADPEARAADRALSPRPALLSSDAIEQVPALRLEQERDAAPVRGVLLRERLEGQRDDERGARAAPRGRRPRVDERAALARRDGGAIHPQGAAQGVRRSRDQARARLP